jgi:hypothetical protein
MTFFPFADFRPDVADIETGVTRHLKNVIADASGYVPMKGPIVYSNALTARCQGAVSIPFPSFTAYTFAGDATKLYKLTDAAFADVSKGGGYSAATTAQWSFAVFGSNVIAVNGTDPAQHWTLDSSTQFADLAGSPPVASFAAAVRDFVFLARISGAPNKLQWSGFNNVTQWTVGVNQSDEQTFAAGTEIMGLVGGDTVYVFLRHHIYYGTYVGGAVIFQFDEIGNGRGGYAQNTMMRAGGAVFFLAHDGFFRIDGAEVRPIGEGRIDKYFDADVNKNSLDRMCVAVDMKNNTVNWAYSSVAQSSGVLDKMLSYNYVLDKWTVIEISAEFIMQSAYTTSLSMDSPATTGDTTVEDGGGSFDDAVWTGGAQQLAGFGTDHKLFYYSGDNLAAQMSLAEVMGPARMYIESGIPVCDTSAATLAVGVRERYADSLSFGAESAMTDEGYCGINLSGRTFAARVSIPAGTAWTHARGVDMIIVNDGAI